MKVVIFKPIERCNSNCIYCDVIKHGDQSIMSYDLLELIFIRMNDYLQLHPEEYIQLIWHGGEPCLLGAEYFIRAHEFQTKHCPGTGSRIKHDVQSNLTIINQDIIDAFKTMGITTVGTSYEPLPNIRGFGKNRDSEAYNRKFFEGVNLLEKNGFRWGAIYVVTRRALEKPLEIFHYLTNMQPGPCFNVVKIFEEDPHGMAITAEEHADWLGAIFPEWYKNRERYGPIKPFYNIMRCLEGKGGALGCEDSGSCAYNWIYIGPKGKTSHCGRSGDYDLLSYGSIYDRTLEEIFTDEQRALLEQRTEVLPEGDCKGCNLWRICHGGCPLDAFIEHGDFMHRHPKCMDKKILFSKYIEPITGLKANFGLEPVNNRS